jgi:hypothetical protein
MSMSFPTWQAIAARHIWYKRLLVERMQEWSQERIDSCRDLATLQRVIRLTERVERHDLRMDRHGKRALELLEGPSAASH